MTHLFKVLTCYLAQHWSCRTVIGLLAICMPAEKMTPVWMSPLQGDQILLVTECLPGGSLSCEALSNIDIPGMWYDSLKDCRSGVWYGW